MFRFVASSSPFLKFTFSDSVQTCYAMIPESQKHNENNYRAENLRLLRLFNFKQQFQKTKQFIPSSLFVFWLFLLYVITIIIIIFYIWFLKKKMVNNQQL